MRKGTLLIAAAAIFCILFSGCSKEHSVTVSYGAVSLLPEETYKLTAACSDSEHNEWLWSSSDESVATVDEAGLVTAVAEGSAEITARCAAENDEAAAVCTVNVDVCRVVMAHSGSGVIAVGENADVSAKVMINDAQTIGAVTWSVAGDENAVEISYQGNTAHVKGVSPGTVTLTATFIRGVSKTSNECTITVVSDVDYRLTLTDTSLGLYPGEKSILAAAVTGDGDTVDCPITWSSSSPGVAVVEEDGTVKAVSPGNAIITASAAPEPGSTITAPCLVTVYENEYSISIFSEADSIYASDTLPFSAEVTKNDDVIHPEINWSVSNDKIAMIKDGVLTGLSGGKVTVTAEYISPEGDSYTANVQIEVMANEYAIALPSVAAELDKGETLVLTPQLSRNGSAYDGKIIWRTSDDTIATVNEGTVTALDVGTVTISAIFVAPVAEGGSRYEASVSLNIVESVYTLTLSHEKLDVYVGESAALSASAGRNGAVIDAKDVSYVVSNSSIISVSGGVVAGLAPGTADVTARWTDPRGEEHTAVCRVTVSSRYYMIVEPTSAQMAVGEEIQVIATTMQRFDDGSVDECYIGAVEWRSSDKAAVTVKAGVVKVLAYSDQPVTVTASWVAPDGLTCSAQFIVEILHNEDEGDIGGGEDETPEDTPETKPPVEGIQLLGADGRELTKYVGSEADISYDITIAVGDVYQLSHRLLPAQVSSADYPQLTWASNDTGVLTVSSTGEIKGIAAGKAVLSLTVGDITVRCIVRVH